MFETREEVITVCMQEIYKSSSEVMGRMNASVAEMAYALIHVLVSLEENERFYDFVQDAMKEVACISTSELMNRNNFLPPAYRIMRKGSSIT